MKDIRQAEALIAASEHARTGRDLGDAWLDAGARGPNWRHLLRVGTARLGAHQLFVLSESVRQAAATGGQDCPFFLADDPRLALLQGGRSISWGGRVD